MLKYLRHHYVIMSSFVVLFFVYHKIFMCTQLVRVFQASDFFIIILKSSIRSHSWTKAYLSVILSLLPPVLTQQFVLSTCLSWIFFILLLQSYKVEDKMKSSILKTDKLCYHKLCQKQQNISWYKHKGLKSKMKALLFLNPLNVLSTFPFLAFILPSYGCQQPLELCGL